MLKQKIDDDDIALALILADPILMPEFLRNTRDGNKNRELWPKKVFKYRGYQRDLLSDKSPYISLIGGRAIGKCQVYHDNIYTDIGYQRIGDLFNKSFMVHAWDEKAEDFTMRRARCYRNGRRTCKRLRTESGNMITITNEHPLLTNNGWKQGIDIQVGDLLATTTRLPHMVSYSIPECEAKLLGYFFFDPFKIRFSERWYAEKNKAIRNDVVRQLDALDVKYQLHAEDPLQFRLIENYIRKGRHPLINLLFYYGFNLIRKFGFNDTNTKPYHEKYFGIPKQLLRFNEENIKQFLGAFLARHADISTREIGFNVPNTRCAYDFQEIMLRCGIETLIVDTPETVYTHKRIEARPNRLNVRVVTRDYNAVYTALTTLAIPGVIVKGLRLPDPTLNASENHRFEKIVSIYKMRDVMTYAVAVERDNTYITQNLIVHNSLVLEDKLLFEVVNNEVSMPETAESLLTTANQNQMTPILDRFFMRCVASPLLRPFIKSNLNKQKGTMDFDFGSRLVRLNARIAGSRGEHNVVGLHVNKVRIDESQVYPLPAFRQLTPVINTWEENAGMFTCGVPNGLTNTTLYQLDKRIGRFKKYRIPAPNNPFFTEGDFNQALRDYGGEDTDLFQNLVLGRHGKGSEQVLSLNDIELTPHDFYVQSFTNQDKLKGISYENKFIRHAFSYESYIAGIDTGFVDPTVIQIFGLRNGKWYLCARYKLQRIEYPEQEAIIHWLHQFYHFRIISIDLGAAGGGATILQSLVSRAEYKSFKYEQIMQGITFNEHVLVGYNDKNEELKIDTKSVGAAALVSFVQSKQIVLSEIDAEGISELERIVKQRTISGQDRYFILSEQGKGKSGADHIFASFICFAMAIRDMSFIKKKNKKLGRTIG